MKKICDFVYIVGSFGGALLIALNIGMNLFGYLLFFLASLASLWLLSKSNASRSLFIVAVGFAIINLIGVFRA